MEISDKELRKALNKAWGKGKLYGEDIDNPYIDLPDEAKVRYRDVGKIIEELKKKETDGMD